MPDNKEYLIQYLIKGKPKTFTGTISDVSKYESYEGFKAAPYSEKLLKEWLGTPSIPTPDVPDTPITPTPDVPTPPIKPEVPTPPTPSTPSTPEAHPNVYAGYDAQGEKHIFSVATQAEADAHLAKMGWSSQPGGVPITPTPTGLGQKIEGFPGSSGEYEQWQAMGRIYKDGSWYEPAAGIPPVAPTPGAPTPPITPTPPVTPTPTAYTIVSGDTLSGIAAKHNTTVDALMTANPQITDPNVIQAGATLNIPGVPVAPTPPVVPVPPVVPTEPVVPVQPVKPGVPTDLQQEYMDTYDATIEELSDPEWVKNKTAEIMEQIRTLEISKEREDKILELVKLAASMGLEYPAEMIAALSDTTYKTEQELKDELYDKYGIEDLEEKFKARPEQTFEEIYQTIYDQMNLADLTTKINDIIAKIDEADADYGTATGKINRNPWLSEAGRVGEIRRVTDAYEITRARLDNQRTLLETLYSRGKQDAESVATRALAAFYKEREFAKEELDYYIQRAEADLKAKLALKEKEEAKELYRYYPEYAEALVTPTEKADLLSVAEAKALGLPYGTTKAEAAAMDITPTTPRAEPSKPSSYKEWELAGSPGTYAEWIGSQRGLSPKVIAQVDKLVKDFDKTPIVSNFNEIFNKKLTFDNIINIGSSGPADLALVFKFMKAMDPTSVVRESEYKTAAEAGNIFLGKYAVFNGYMKEEGGFLPTNVKEKFQEIVNSDFEVITTQYRNLRDEYIKKIDRKTGDTDGSDWLTEHLFETAPSADLDSVDLRTQLEEAEYDYDAIKDLGYSDDEIREQLNK